MTETYPQKITFGAMLEMGVRDVLPLIRKSPQMKPKEKAARKRPFNSD